MVNIRGILAKICRRKPKEMVYSPRRILDMMKRANDGETPKTYQFAQSAVDTLIHIPPDQVAMISDAVAKLDYGWVGKYDLRIDDKGVIRAKGDL